MTHPEQSPKARVVYILAASHSGSTLLAMLLGSHPETCTVGELKATALGDPDRYVCSCGARIKECAFWQRVSAEMGQRGVPFEITNAGTDIRTGASRYTRRVLRPLCRGAILERLRNAALWLSPTWRAKLPEIQHRNRLLVEALCEVHGVRVLVDSSKIGLRLKYLLRDPTLDVKVVRLIRDGRAVALTYSNPHEFADARDPRLRGGGNRNQHVEQPRSVRAAAREWRRSNEEAECILRGLPKSQWTEVRYEDVCTDPDRTLDRLFRFLGLDPQQRLRDFRSRTRHVVGNGMRLDSTTEIRLDDRWRSVLTPSDLRVFDSVAGEMNRRYGYTDTGTYRDSQT
ncbi:MAG: sulfotransferase [Phycisphaerae bacterium]|nr:sulfotransferase [Phycisphaerae bacterium]